MINIATPEITLGFICLAAAVLFGAWYEWKQKNSRDARALAAVGTLCVAGGLISIAI